MVINDVYDENDDYSDSWWLMIDSDDYNDDDDYDDYADSWFYELPMNNDETHLYNDDLSLAIINDDG